MNQGESTNSIATLDGSSLEKQQIIDSRQTYNSYYLSNSAEVSWGTQAGNDSSKENVGLSNTSNNHDQQVEQFSRNIQDGTNMASVDPASSSGATSMVQDYSGYVAYPNTDPYGYSSTGYAAYYNQYQQHSSQYQQAPDQYQQPANQYQQAPDQYQQPPNQYQQPPNQCQQPPDQYQQPSNQYRELPAQYQQPPTQYQQPPTQHQQPPPQHQQLPPQYQQPPTQYQQLSNQSFPHHTGAYQNTGAPYQPLSSFQNVGSCAGPASYSSTYLGPTDYQTSGNYTSGTYGTRTNLWHGGQHTTYNSQYSNNTPDSNSAYSLSNAVGTSEYQQQYKQWEDYYNQTQTEVSCAPGTENVSVSSAPSVACSFPSGNSEYAVSNNQIPAAYEPSWRPVSSSSEPSSVQPVTESSNIPEGYWKNGPPIIQNDLPNTVQSHIQNPQDKISMHESFQSQQNSTFSQGPTSFYPVSYQVSHSRPSSFQTVLQPPEQIDSRKASKLQIPTNPRIASSLSLSMQKTDKNGNMTSRSAKPAYISVSMQTPNAKVASHDDTDSSVKPVTFPNSLLGYVERALARCKDDRQKAASQDIMKKVITEATADGTLNSRNWDTEPLFPIPSIDAVNKDNSEYPVPTFATANNRRSPGRRAKSRWEPISDGKLVGKSANTPNGTAKYGGWNKQLSGGNSDNKASWGNKFSLSDQKRYNKNVGRPTKRQHLSDDLKAADDSEASSDSDVEHSLTKYYSAAIALTDSPEEKKRRENRSKRFDKGHGNQTKPNNSKAKEIGSGNLYARKASALVLSGTSDESGSRAVEDIDWDALTIKGTCQEIEKRYLRLTSAPDPATVRPEEVLEKALLMVQTSQKNYLYKCDQLKSLRQDLTVQHIRDELTVKVYETHARLAIEAGDLPEYNQCLSQLKTLYAEGIRGCHMEFAAYNLLCVILHSNNNRDVLSAMSRLSADAKRDEAVIHALSVRTAVTSGNYVMFFRLYKTAPNLSPYLMDLYVEKMRYAAVKCMCRSYRPSVPVLYLSQILGFGSALPTSDEKKMDSVEECMEWLKVHGACFTSENTGELLLDTKASVSSLFMPEPEDAVSHGDANLAVNDFLTRSLV